MHYTTELGKMRNQEAIARAEHYRLVRDVKKANAARGPQGAIVTFAYRRALAGAAVALVLSAGFFI